MPKRIFIPEGRKEVTFRYNGRTLKGYENEPIAAALLANGSEYVHRSPKFRHPRGVRCANGRCGQCIVSVDGRPNVRSCIERLRQGMDVRTQTGWPSAEFDLLRPLGGVVAHLPHGFHYRMFIKPMMLRPFIYRMLRKYSGFGRANPGISEPPSFPPARQVEDVEVLIVGGGVAGMACALELAKSGRGVLLLDDRPRLGGSARSDLREENRRMAEQLATSIAQDANVQVRLERMAVSFDNGVLSAATPTGIEKFRPRFLVVATGGYDYIPPFAGNDRFCVFGLRALSTLVVEWGVVPADRIVVTGGGADEIVAALSTYDIYAEVEPEPRAPGPDEATTILASIPTYELQYHAEICMGVDDHGAVRALLGEGGVSSRPDLFVTGEAAGPCEYREAARRGTETGSAVVRALNGETIKWTPAPTRKNALSPAGPVAGAVLCLCEDVTEEEFAEALAGDFPDIESAKRYTSVSMGMCQGKYCLHRARELTASVRGIPLSEVPLTTQRPPIVPVPFGVLAARREEASKP